MKEKLFNVNQYKNWHGPDYKLRQGRPFVLVDMEERYKQKEQEKRAALKAEKEEEKRAKKEARRIRAEKSRATKKAKKKSEKKLLLSSDRTLRAYYQPRLRELEPTQKTGGAWAAKMGLFGDWFLFGAAYTYEEAKRVLDHKCKLRNELFKKIKMRRYQAYSLEAYNLFEKYLKFECKNAYNEIIQRYGKREYK